MRPGALRLPCRDPREGVPKSIGVLTACSSFRSHVAGGSTRSGTSSKWTCPDRNETRSLAAAVPGPSRRRPCSQLLVDVSQRKLVPERVPRGHHTRHATPRLHEQPNTARVGRAVRATTRPLRPTRSAGRIRNAIEDTVSSAASALKYPADVDSMALYKKLVAPVREVLFRQWDPIGVATDPNWPSDEYDSYIPGVIGFLQRRATAEELATYLDQITYGRMGMAPVRGRSRAAAVALLSLWQDALQSFP